MAKKKRAKAEAPPEDRDPEPRGWDAITAAFERLYPRQTNPKHYAPAVSPIWGGDNYIYGISAYEAAGPGRHWHMVTYGFTELYEKESDDPGVSGWGFELTFRLARGREKNPPAWAINFLTNLGQYVYRSRNPFGPGHHMDLNGPIALGSDTAVRGIAFTPDPQLGTVDTPNGRVLFLQVVGVTRDELDACGDWQTDRVLELLRESNPLLITDLARRSILDDPATAARVRAGIDRDGSQSGSTFVAVVDWSVNRRKKPPAVAVTLGARGIDTLVRRLRSRLGHGRPFAVFGREKGVEFRPGKRRGVKADKNVLAVTLTPAAVEAVRGSLRPVRGTYTWPELPGLTIEVQPSTITDSEGNVVEVIG